MNTATTQKDAANSTPPASPAASQVAEEIKGAETGDVTAADVAAALGLKPDGQETDADDESADDEAQAGAEDLTGDEPADDDAADEGDEAGADKDGETDESDDKAAEGDAAAESGESTATEESAGGEEGEEPADTKGGKKNEQFQHRINELTSEKKSAQEEAAQLREKLSTYQARESGTLDAGALDAVDSPQELQQLRARYVSLQKWALSNPDGGKMPDGKGGETEFTREEVAHIHGQTFELLNTAVPQREQYLAHRARAEDAAIRSYPWLSDRTKGDGLMVQKAIEALPSLRTVPSYRIIAANAFVGEKLRAAGITVDDALIQRLVKEKAGKQGANGKQQNGDQNRRSAAPPPRAPAAPGRAGSLPPRRTPAAAEIRAQEKRLSSSSGSVGDIAASIAAKLQPARR